MKKSTLLLIAVFAAFTAYGQVPSRFSCSTALGTGFAMSEPATTPLVWRLTGYYNVSRRFSAGIGTGLSFYEKTLIPLFADARFLITRPRRFTPYAACAAGYGFAPGKEASGGLLLNPEVGVQYALPGRTHLFLSAGYELQHLDRLKKYAGPYFSAEFKEKLRHGTILLKIGFLF